MLTLLKTDFIHQFLRSDLDIPRAEVNSVRLFIVLISIIILGWIAHKVAQFLLIKSLGVLVEKTKNNYDDILFEKKTFKWLAQAFPALLLYFCIDFVFVDYPDAIPHAHTAFNAYLTIIFFGFVISLLNSTQLILLHQPLLKDKPIASYVQLAKMVVYLIGGILLLSIIMGKSPIYFLSAMGAVSAVLLLVFKDTILGFVASIHISANDMVRVGDWVTIEKYGADGDVVEINLATVKVQNFDKTITTIPTYALVSDSFKNWRGMQESEGRRIKRAIYIDKSTIQFLTAEQIEKLKDIELLKPYLEDKKEQIEANINGEINGSRLTNIGTFRKYLDLYLEKVPAINTEMTKMVRQLNPTERGLPLEIYAFTSEKEWVKFESIVSDIFDHILAITPLFDLAVYQNPSGNDFKQLVDLQKAKETTT